MKYGNVFKNLKVQILFVAVALSIFALFLSDANPYTFDAKLGLEFVGGVRIPVTLEKSVDSNTMDAVVETLKNRINTFGLSQVVIRPIGDSEVLVEIPRADERVITSVKTILQEQGRFEALIDGRQAVNGETVVAVGGPNGEETPSTLGTSQWSLSFTVTRSGADQFAEAGRGKANYPVYMFLDRPENAAVIVRNEEIGTAPLPELQAALKKQGDDMLLLFSGDVANSTQLFNKSQVIVSQQTLETVENRLSALGFSQEANASKKIVVLASQEMQPVMFAGELSEWPAIGLLSAPQLSESLSFGTASQFYSINGAAVGATPQEQEAYAVSQIKQLKSIISGGKLPVSALVGSSFSIEPLLGRQFLLFSIIATFIAILAVSLLVVVRYRDIRLSVPIIVINACEILILAAIIGRVGTLDLAAMAGIISLIGTGVDDQLIVTDEVLRRRKEEEAQEEYTIEQRIARAFSIIFTTAGVAIVAMLPLLLSGIVEISGFALAAIIGIIIGVLLTRPAFAVFIEEMYKK
ncbi:hypothetical protein HY571_02165 [Candidatus Micrarchaeota archaeon]|nr:hypothetical protein [Candidatus Micrarchaeota archaeon]